MHRVTLSFDNGPAPEVTPQVLGCLARHKVPATFFVLGSRIEEPGGAAMARRAAREGHWIGNHTFSHTTPLGQLSEREALDEFERTEQALESVLSAGSQPARLFRPAGGGIVGPNLLHPAVAERLVARGIQCVLWNSLPGDWRDPDGWVERGLADCRTRDWSLVVLHDIPTGAMKHLDGFIRRLRDEDFELTQEFPPDCVPESLENYCSGILR